MLGAFKTDAWSSNESTYIEFYVKELHPHSVRGQQEQNSLVADSGFSQTRAMDFSRVFCRVAISYRNRFCQFPPTPEYFPPTQGQCAVPACPGTVFACLVAVSTFLIVSDSHNAGWWHPCAVSTCRGRVFAFPRTVSAFPGVVSSSIWSTRLLLAQSKAAKIQEETKRTKRTRRTDTPPG